MSEESPKETIVKILDLDEEEEESAVCDGTPTKNSEERHQPADTELEPQKRVRKITEKGRVYQMEILSRKRQNAGQKLSREIRNTYDLIRDVTVVDLEIIEKQREDLDRIKEQLTQAHIEYDDILSDEQEVKQASYSWFDVRDREYIECRIKLTERIKAFEEKLSRDNESIHSRRSNQSFRSCGSSGSTRSLLLKASVNSARLKVEMDFLEKESEIRRLSLKKEIAAAEAEERAIKQFLAQENAQDKNDMLLSVLDNTENKNHDPNVTQLPVSNKIKVERSFISDDVRNSQFPEIKIEEATGSTRTIETPAHKPVPKPRSIIPRNEKENPEETVTFPVASAERSFKGGCENETLKYLVALQAKQTELSSLLVRQQSATQLPAKEPPTFDGNAFEYPAFATAFDAIISANVSSDRDRLYYLEKYTKGKASDVVKGFLSVASNDSYQQARKLLDERFGNPIHVAEAYKLRMRNWPNIGEGSSKALQEFSDFLVRCAEAVKTIGSPAELDTTDTLIAMTAKLPSYSGIKWCRQAHEMRTKSKKVTFADFVKFVKEEAELANDPIFSPDALKRETRKTAEREFKPKPKRREFSSNVGSFAINTLPSSTRSASSHKSTSCPACKKDHSLERCSVFKAKPEDERRDLITSKGFCFGCLRPGHLSSSCQDRLRCDECGKSHPTPLHGVRPKPKPRTKRKPENSAISANTTTVEPQGWKPDPATATADEKANPHASVCYSAEDSEEAITSLIVPIVLSHKNNPEVEVKAYALLDDGSDSTFVKTSVLEKLGIGGPEITLQLNTMHGQRKVIVKKIEGLIAKAMDEAGCSIELPKTYTRDSIPSCSTQIPTPEVASKWPHLQQIGSQLLPLQDNMEVGVLIGCNCPKALKPRQVILGGDDDPYAIKTSLGWGILGPSNVPRKGNGFTCHRVVTIDHGPNLNVNFAAKTQTKEVIYPEDIKAMFELDFSEREQGNVPLSLEDRKFLTIVKGGIRQLSNGHYELPLPVKDDNLTLPNNRAMAANRLKSLKRRLLTDKTYRAHYVEFMKTMLEKGYAEPAPQVSREQQTWYIPHHGVYHPKKPNKLRVVFDCSAQHRGESLNKHLLQGPDLTNNLTGVLYRFRREHIAIMCDIEAMFYQVKVPEASRDLLRFLWWEDGDTSQEPKEYRMTVHLFGAASSPGCANFALKTTADDNETDVGKEPAEFVRRNFYVDDGLTSVPTVKEAVKLASSVKEMCKRGGFNLHKFTSNRKEVLQRIPEKDRVEVKSLEFSHGSQMTERALGVQWCIDSDVFKFTIALKDRPCTRRGILSTVSSIFDPLGFLAPVMLEGKSLLQDLCRLNIGWDDQVPDEMAARWRTWKTQLRQLESLEIPRCYKPEDFGFVEKAELHHFSDASFRGYSQCSYLRLVNSQGRIHCTFMTGKSRVTPLKKVTVPRLELTAAVVSVRVSEQLKRELEMQITKEVFWTDSKVVLGYIANEVRRFHVFVANRVQEIQERSSTNQWMYVDTKDNPADEGSRGLRADRLDHSKWLLGPEFLWRYYEKQDTSTNEGYDLQDNDPEVKKSVALSMTASIQQPEKGLEENLRYFSDWHRTKRAVALCVKLMQRMRNKTKRFNTTDVNVSDLEDAATRIIKATQATFYSKEMASTKNAQREEGASCSKETMTALRKLDPFVDSNGLLRVGGRLRHSSLSSDIKFPVILPAQSHVTSLLIRHFHEKINHQGRSFTLSEVRANGYWITGGTKAVGRIIEDCVNCNKLRAKGQEQKMADLPEDRLEPAPPFTNCAVDYFGPFIIKERRKEIKRYGVLFTCLSSRAVHLEVANTLETDSFINAYRRFVSRRGPVRMLRCDQGTNFVGARRELAEGLKEMDQTRIKRVLLKDNCDWFVFKMNVPAASHMGGVWERQIRTVRNVLSSILHANSTQLNDESLRTFMCEVESIVNCRPLTVDNLSDPDSLTPLSPNQLLTLKTKVLMAPPGEFQSADLYSKKWWRRVQHLANEFWSRWRKEFLLTLQPRQKWTRSRRDVQVNDIVIIKDDNLPRSSWPLGRVQRVNRSADGRVRSALVSLAEGDRDSEGKRTTQPRSLERPIQKLVVLMKSGDTQTG